MGFVEPSTPLTLDELESVCDTGHVHNKHLDYCPWCLEGHGPGYQLIDHSTESRK